MIDSHKNWLHRAIDRAILYFSYHEMIDGLWIGAFVNKKESVQILGNLREALAIVRDNDPYRYRRIVRRLDKIFVHPTPNQGEYVRELRRCILGTDMVARVDIKQIALVIIHEATHAELMDRGIGYETEIRQRVEDVCSRQEIAFGRKFADRADLLENTEIRMTLPAETWSNDAMIRRDIEWLERDGSLPKWFVCGMLKLRAWRIARARRGRVIIGVTAAADQPDQAGLSSSN